MRTSFAKPFPHARLLPLALACLLCASPGAALAEYRVELDAPAPLKQLLTGYLDLFRFRDREDIGADQLNFMVATAADQVARLASTEGYFSTRTTASVDRESGTPVVRLRVESGPRTMVSNVDIQVSGAAAQQSAAQVERMRRRWSLDAGEPFRSEDWNAAKQNGLQILQNRRYPAARIADSEARVYADRQQAELSVNYDSGPLFTFGDVRVSGTQRYPESIVRNVNPLRAGEEYSADRLLEYQRQILRTPYFSNAVISIDQDPANAAHAPVDVHVTEYPQQYVRGSVGYTTDTGARLEGVYSHNNIFDRAWVLNARARLEQRYQSGSAELAMPPRPGPWVDSAFGSLERTTVEGVDLRSRRLGVRTVRNADKDDTEYALQYYRDELLQLSGAALPPDTVVLPGAHQALVAGVSKTWRDVDNPRFPRRGHVLTAQAGAAVKGLLTDQTFLRAYGRLQQFLPAGRRDIVILRGELGAVLSKTGNASIPASLLFRAGGTESVRGYSYQSIGNERDGTVYPARYLVTGSAEYDHWLTQTWGGAVFYDAGMASDSWSDRSFFHAVGVGVRWRSPVGRVNADLAYGIQAKQLRPHLSLGAAF